MRLTSFTDYALRVLIHLALHPGRLWSIAEIARSFGLSHNHLMKVVTLLGRAGFVETVRGRSGGIRLARAPETILVGEVVRVTEDGFQLADCPECVLFQVCGLSGIFAEGSQAMLDVFNRYRISDLMGDGDVMRRRIALKYAGAGK